MACCKSSLNKITGIGLAVIAASSLFLFSRSLGGRRYIFIDGGSHFGESIAAFKGTGLYKAYPWKIYAIEADPRFAARIPKAADVTVIDKAAWIKDGKIDFYLSLPGGTRSSLFQREQYNKTKVQIDCFDFGKWIKDNFREDDYIILSLDMAGAEYAVLDKMISDNSIEYCDRVYVEFSSEMYIGEEHSADESHAVIYRIVEKIREKGIIFDYDSVEGVIGERHTWQDHL
jgi:FkbM family methyltransferase